MDLPITDYSEALDMMNRNFPQASGRLGVHRGTLGIQRLAVVGVALLGAVACNPDNILKVEDIDVALPSAVADSSALPSVLAGAIGDFGVAYNGPGANGSLNQVDLSGLISDEFINTETFPTRIEIDQRRQRYDNNGTLSNLFYDTQQARASADLAASGFARFLPKDIGFATALNLSAFTYIFFAENYCGAVPISHQLPSGDFDYGPALTTQQLLDVAIQKADSALALATSSDATGSGATKAQQATVARLIKARALLDLDRPADAAAAIGGEPGVPTTFQYIYPHSETTGRQNNGTWALTISVGRFGVADMEGVNGLPFQSEGDLAGSVQDPRVSNQKRGGRGTGFDGATIQYMQMKYAKRDTLSIIAGGIEARLIEAEAKLRANDYPGALAMLNELRTDPAVIRSRGYVDSQNQPLLLPPLAPAATPDAQVDQLFKERAYWLFLTSHRLGDLRRLVRQYGRATESVYPTGTYHKSGTYGTDVNSPVPQAEDNNPEFNRSACVVTDA